MTPINFNDNYNSKFIITEPLGQLGETGEQLVWETIERAFADRECVCYWRYPIFAKAGKLRREADILILDRELGLIIIEVKSLHIDQIVQIQGHRWDYQDFYAAYGNPFQQAESQLLRLLDYSQQEPNLKNFVTGRVMVALPLIKEENWQERGFHKLPSQPPIIFSDYLNKFDLLLQVIIDTSPLILGQSLNNYQWQLLLSIIAGTPVLRQPIHRVLSHQKSKGKILQELKQHLFDLDLNQETIAKQIPPGMQRIRGIAGSGKTVLLCQKAVNIHLKNPDWYIALVFFSRSLYHPICQLVDKWLRYFSNNELSYNPNNQHLRILHAWGSKKQPGLYSILCREAGFNCLTANETISKKPSEALAEVCLHLLKSVAIPQVFDALLIDEGQDLIADNWKFEDKQPFYWLAYQSLRPVNPIYPTQRRLIWAYDEVQSLDNLIIPNARELFGEDLGHLVTGYHPGGIKKSEILYRCYRTPHTILTAAHAIGMGLLRPQGMLTGITRKQEWEAIGYQVEGNFIAGNQITLKRPLSNSVNPIAQLWQDQLIEFKIYRDRATELKALVANLKHNLRYDGLRPSKEILVIILGNYYDSIQLEEYTARFLMRQGLDIFIPGNQECNIIKPDRNHYNPNKFWDEGAITVSRIHRAKGQEADLVYIIGLDYIAQNESNINLRNQLFVALTRSRAWVNISGIGTYPLYQELEQVIKSKDTFNFIFRKPPQREIVVTDAGELLTRIASGKRNFQDANLSNANLEGVNLENINLIGANLHNANLRFANLSGVKLIVADLSYADLSYANLTKAKLMGANLQYTKLDHVDLSNANLDGVIW